LFNASAAVRTDDEVIKMSNDTFFSRYGQMIGELEGESRITNFWNQNSIIFLAKQLSGRSKAIGSLLH